MRSNLISLLKNLLNRGAFILANGYILLFYSELLFWARWKPRDSLLDYAFTWLAYSLLAYVFLSLVALFRIHSLPAIFLAGAIFGWLGEGVLVQTMYENFPLQIPWTGLAWHALISVLFGWQAMQTALRRSSPGTALVLASAAGIFWGFWSVFWWIEEPDFISSPAAFTAFAFTASALLILAYWLAGHFSKPVFSPGWPLGLAIALLTILFAFTAVPTEPWAPLVLLPLLGLTLLGLWFSRRAGSSYLDDLSHPIHIPNLATLLVMPLIASIEYTLAYAFGLRWQTNLVIFTLTTLLGTILWFYSLGKTTASRLRQRL